MAIINLLWGGGGHHESSLSETVSKTQNRTQDRNLNFAVKNKAPADSCGGSIYVLAFCKTVLLIPHLLEHNNYSPVKCDRRGFVFV